MTPQNKIENLRTAIEAHNQRYYIDNEPIIGDREFEIGRASCRERV